MVLMVRDVHKALLWVVAAAGVAAMGWGAGRLSAQDAPAVTSEQVSGAIQKGVALLARQQAADGSWPGGGHRGGMTALALLALVNAGTPVNDPAILRGMEALDRVPNEATYVVSLKAQVYAAASAAGADPKKYQTQLRAAAAWLLESQLDNGMWGYATRKSGRGDNSNTQFALLGLHEAAKAGVSIPLAAWEISSKHFLRTQLDDGGWTYQFSESARDARGQAAYGSMTAAGVASLYICGQRLNEGGKHVFLNGAYPDCGRYQQNEALVKGHEWLTKNFSVRENPNHGQTWLYYYLYGLERVGMISGTRNFGPRDWYREGAAFLVGSQRAGGFGGGVQDVAFAILFLAKGNRPVLFEKLQWKHPQNAGEWNRNLHDLENLVAFVADKLGKPTTWQSVTLDLPLKELRQSPVLYITGHEFPQFSKEELAKLREFVETGGTILADACCSSEAFRRGFRQFARDLFEDKYRLDVLRKDHPVFSSYYRLDDTYDLEGMDVGCRTSVFFSPRALSCLWELQDIPPWSEKAFKIGTNIAAYATGREQLRNKLELVELPAVNRAAATPAEIPRGAVRIATIVHDGDYKADLNAMVNLTALLRDEAKVDVVAQGRYLKTSDPNLFQYPVVFMTGHFSFKLPDEEIKALRLYLERGGVLVADACCGQKAFDASFREMIRQVFPENELKQIPDDHPIITGQSGTPLGELKYRQILQEELQRAGNANWRGTTHPPLETVALKGRTAVIYSKYDWSCALEGDRPYSCRGYSDEDGRKLARNIFLFAISY
jgi:hypothetical protein